MLPFTLLTAAAFVNISLAVFVYRRNPQSQANKAFAFLCLTLTGWALANASLGLPLNSRWSTFSARATFVFASLIPLAFYLFSETFPRSPTSPRRLRIAILIALAFLMAFLSLTPLIASSATSQAGFLKVHYGPFHPVFALYLVSTIALGVVILVLRFRMSRGIERLQLQYVILAISLTAAGGVATNLIAPLFWGSSRFSHLGPVFSLVLVGLIAHSIVRHRLMNLRIVAHRGITYLLTTLALSFVLFLFGALTSSFTVPSRTTGSLAFLPYMTVVLSLALLYQPVKRYLQDALDRYFFRQAYNTHTVLRDTLNAITSTFDLTILLTNVTEILIQAFRPEHIAIYSASDDAAGYSRVHSVAHPLASQSALPLSVPSSHSLILAFSRPPRYLADDELQRSSRPDTAAVSEQLNRLGTALAVPLADAASLSGFMLFGRKLSGDPYFPEDVELLLTLAPHLSAALQHATFYKQLYLAHKFIENVLTTMDSGVIAVAPDGRITLSNAAARNILGLPPHASGKIFASLLPRSLREPLFHTLTSRSPHRQLEIEIPVPPDRSIPLLFSSTCLQDVSGDLVGAVAIFSDLARVKQLELDKRRIERLAAIGALAAGVAHEIKNPLVAIRTFAELLPERFHDDEFRHTFARLAISEIDRIDRLVASLRSLAIDSTQSREPVALQSVIADTLTLLQARIEKQCVSVSQSWPDDLPLLNADATRLRQLFLNLLGNSLDAMPDRGCLSISAQTQSNSEIQVLLIEICDTGPGIPSHLLEEIFEPFVTTKPQGAGLGLSICRGIAEAHRATLTARNRSDSAGAVFSIAFPLDTLCGQDASEFASHDRQMSLVLPGFTNSNLCI